MEVVELGSGIGKASGLMAKKGARVTCLDFSDKALEKGREIFAANLLRGQFVKGDVLSLPPELVGRFSVSMSWGLVEHFTGDQRRAAIESHFRALRPGGMAFITVPNSYCFPYRIFKFMAEILGKWKIAPEYPFSKEELRAICRSCGINDYSFEGSSFFTSFQFLDFPYLLSRALKLKEKRPDQTKIKKEKRNFLDRHFGAALILVARK